MVLSAFKNNFHIKHIDCLWVCHKFGFLSVNFNRVCVCIWIIFMGYGVRSYLTGLQFCTYLSVLHFVTHSMF